MSYPGDPALASDVQQRILTTFQQTLDLASKGSRQESLLGCDFILRLDPQFGPARTLQQLVQAGRSGPQLAALFSGVEVAPPAAALPVFEDLPIDVPDDFGFAAPAATGGRSHRSYRSHRSDRSRRSQGVVGRSPGPVARGETL